MKTKADCYGKMFPDVIHLLDNEGVTGRVFGYRLDHPGMTVTNRIATADRRQWQQCLECPELDGCYRLSIGMVLMQLAMKKI